MFINIIIIKWCISLIYLVCMLDFTIEGAERTTVDQQRPETKSISTIRRGEYIWRIYCYASLSIVPLRYWKVEELLDLNWNGRTDGPRWLPHICSPSRRDEQAEPVICTQSAHRPSSVEKRPLWKRTNTVSLYWRHCPHLPLCVLPNKTTHFYYTIL